MSHKHHIIPRHVGGTDDPTNLIELTVEEHALAHQKLYEQFGRWQDYVAWQGLSKLVSREQIDKILQSQGGKVGGQKSIVLTCKNEKKTALIKIIIIRLRILKYRKRMQKQHYQKVQKRNAKRLCKK